jgi:transposase-like protein
MIMYCPYCGKPTMEHIGISGIGSIYRCKSCRRKIVIG